MKTRKVLTIYDRARSAVRMVIAHDAVPSVRGNVIERAPRIHDTFDLAHDGVREIVSSAPFVDEPSVFVTV